MRIIQVVPSFPPSVSGDGIHVCNISKELVERGHSVTVLTYSLDTKETQEQSQSFSGLDVRRFHSFFKNAYLLFSPKLIATLLKADYDLVHCHRYFSLSSFPSALVTKVRRKPFVFTAHSPTMARRKNVLLASLKRMYDALFGYTMFKITDKLIALTSDNVKDYIHMKADHNKIRVIPNGVDLSRFRDLPDPQRFKKRFCAQGKVVLSIGRLVEHKGFQYLVQMAPHVLKHFPETSFVVAGPDFGYRDQLESMARKLRVNDHIVFTGRLSENELLEAYAAADIFAFTSRHEGFGIVLLEAMASGIPVIGWKTSAMQYIINDGTTGFLVAPWDMMSFSEKICLLLSNARLASFLGANGRQLVKTQYSVKSVVDRLESTYAEAIAETI